MAGQLKAKGPAGGSIAFGSVGAGYTPFYTIPADTRKILFMNSLDKPVDISLNGGTTDWMPVCPTATSFVVDIDTSMIAGGGSAALNDLTSVAVKHIGAAPTTGFLSVSVITAG